MNLALTTCGITWCFIKKRKFSARFYYAIIDEVDSILIDEARTPLIISGAAKKSTNLYVQANAFVRTLKKDEDYTYDEKTKGVHADGRRDEKSGKGFSASKICLIIQHVALNHHITQALKAHVVMQRDTDYVVQDGRSRHR